MAAKNHHWVKINDLLHSRHSERAYSHAVVVWKNPKVDFYGRPTPPSTQVYWASSRELAEKKAQWVRNCYKAGLTEYRLLIVENGGSATI